ncbi:hypothetical protein V866_008548 [Kwoniella sp. B9012]|uniref:Protein CPL1-like domain-containing protein n=1 Tax=Kwoniella europaea PYCC6329 TaxID=1423913 RepID=A0AAX4KVV8_9TREE
MFLSHFLAFFVLFVQITLGDVFAGCFDPRILPTPEGLSYDSYLESCQDICRPNGTDYSYSYPDPADQGDFPTLRICQCGFDQPDGQYLIPTSLCDYPNIQVFYLPSPGDWSFSGCLYLPGTPSTQVTSLVQCLNLCNGYPIAFTVYVDNHIFCSCTLTIPNPDDLQTVCGLGDWFVYSETVLPSGFVAKKRLAKDGDQGLCPKGLTACRADLALSSSFDYECINTDEELESCGGCLFGQLHVEDGRSIFGIGLDCTQLPGVRSNGVTCLQGECSIFACDDEYSLHAGICVPF